jgi:hypothetical protein
MIPALAGVFRVTTLWLGPMPGYLAGFAVYWVILAALSLAVLGRRGTAGMLALR